MAIDLRYLRLPFAAALDFFRSKITLGTDRWDDLTDDEYDAFFTVAGAKGSLLSEIRAAVDDAITQGLRPSEFRERFNQIADGWVGQSDWRADLIYRTNLRTAYGRGRDEQQQDPEVRRLQPYLQFQHSDNANARPHHLALDGQIFLTDQVPFALPNGFNCGCRYTSLSQRQFERLGGNLSTLTRGSSTSVTLPNGQQVTATIAPEPGWDRMPGASRGAQRQAAIDRVTARMAPAIAIAVQQDTARFDPPLAPDTPRTKMASPIDRTAPDAFERSERRSAQVRRLHADLSTGRFAPQPGDDDRTTRGKAGALSALYDATNSKIGLVASVNPQGDYTGFLSFKPGRGEVEIENLGTDGTLAGSGRVLFDRTLAYAAQRNLGLSVAPVPSAIGFYEKMGMRKISDGALALTAAEVQELMQRRG